MNSLYWQSQESECHLNPRLPQEQQRQVQEALQSQKAPGVVWLQSSGTESGALGLKLVALPKRAILTAAEAVCSYFQISSQDIWANPLPLFHVGGLSISARCHVSGAQEVRWSQAWEPRAYTNWLHQTGATWTSLVPTQIYDLVEQELAAPQNLRGVLVGGGALDQNLWQKALGLGWPLITSYGMTETCALIAASQREPLIDVEPKLTLLPHVKLFPASHQRFRIESEALFSGYLLLSQEGQYFWQPRPDPFVLDDLLVLNSKNQITVLGRQSQLIKILGETVHLHDLSRRLSERFKMPVELFAEPDARRGHVLYALYEGEERPEDACDLNQHLMPFERIQAVFHVASFPRTELGKIHRAQLALFLQKKLK